MPWDLKAARFPSIPVLQTFGTEGRDDWGEAYSGSCLTDQAPGSCEATTAAAVCCSAIFRQETAAEKKKPAAVRGFKQMSIVFFRVCKMSSKWARTSF